MAHENNAFNIETFNEKRSSQDIKRHNSIFIDIPYEKRPSQVSSKNNDTIIQMPDDSLQAQMSSEGARAMAELSARITVTFYSVSKVINVPAKMIDPSSFVTRGC